MPRWLNALMAWRRRMLWQVDRETGRICEQERRRRRQEGERP